MNSWVWLWIDTTWNDFWVNLGVKSLLVVLAALLLSMLLRYAPARLRYSNFKIAFFALFVIPFGGFFPSLFMQSQPTRVPAESVISQLPVPYRKPLTANNVITESQKTTALPAPAQNSLIPSGFSTGWLLYVWGFGAGIYLLFLLFQFIYLRQLINRGERNISSAWKFLLASSSKQMRVSKKATLIFSDEVKVPFTYGWKNTLILLPIKANDWDHEKRKTLILHELGHVQSGDFQFNIFVQLMKAFYWWNPLVWYLAKASKLECENSCDELVLESGVSHIEYASRLVDIARIINLPNTKANAFTVPIANRPELKKRVSRILKRPKTNVTKRSLKTLRVAFCMSLALLFFNFSIDSFSAERSELLLSSLSDSRDTAIAVSAITDLGRLGSKSSIDSLLKALKHDDPEVKAAAAWALGQIKDPDAVGKLLPLTKDKSTVVKKQALLSLGEYEITSTFYEISEQLNHPDPEIRKAAIWSLYKIGCLISFQRIGQHVRDEDADVKKLASQLLANFPKDKLRLWLVNVNFGHSRLNSSYADIKRMGMERLLIERIAKNKNEMELLNAAMKKPDSAGAIRGLIKVIK